MNGPESVDGKPWANTEELFDAIPEAALVHDPAGAVVAANRPASETFGLAPEEGVATSIADVATTHAPDELRSRWASLERGEHTTYEARFRRRDASPVAVAVAVRHVGGGDEARFLSTVRHGSATAGDPQGRRANRSLRDADGPYRTLFEESRDALMLIDRDGYVDCNEATLQLFGVESAETFLERAPWDLSPPEMPDGRSAESAARAHMEQAFREGSASFEWTHRRADGSTFEAAVTLSRFEHGDQPLLLAQVRDVTERKRRERELRELNERLELAIRGANLGVWDWDMAADEVTFNEQWLEMLGYSPEGTDRQFDAWEPAHPDDVADAKADLQAHLDGETEFYETEHRIRTADGEWRWVWDIGKVAEYDDDGNPTRAVGIHLDVDDRKRAEQQVKSQRDNLETLNRVLRHDVRNDLQLVQAHAEALADGLDDEEPREHVDRLLESVEHAVGLTRQAGEMAEVMLAAEDDRQAVDLRRVLRAELEDLRAAYPDADVETGSIPSVEVSANDMLDSVFRNLLKNAVQHNDTGRPRVRVSATERDESAVVRIADDGPGISDDRKSEIFGRGQTGLESSGTGIGLHLVETLVDGYGGRVRVGDNDPRGAVFVVELPLAA